MDVNAALTGCETQGVRGAIATGRSASAGRASLFRESVRPASTLQPLPRLQEASRWLRTKFSPPCHSRGQQAVLPHATWASLPPSRAGARGLPFTYQDNSHPRSTTRAPQNLPRFNPCVIYFQQAKPRPCSSYHSPVLCIRSQRCAGTDVADLQSSSYQPKEDRLLPEGDIPSPTPGGIGSGDVAPPTTHRERERRKTGERSHIESTQDRGMAGSVVRVGVAQMTATGNLEENFATCIKLIQEAKSKGCKFLSLPECFSFIGEKEGESLSKAEPLDGPLMGRYRQLARDFSLWLSLGGFQESGPDPSHLCNTHVLVDEEGSIHGVYRKIHLFDVDIPGGPRLKESSTTIAGKEAVVVDSPAGRLGLTICYDLRFPELYQQMRFINNAEVLLVPSAFTKATGEAHWEVLLRARAIECQCYVLAAAQAGKHNSKRESFGHALIIDPWGKVIGRLEDPLATGVAVADMDFNLIHRVRERMPVAQHRRYDIYGYRPKSEEGEEDGKIRQVINKEDGMHSQS